MPGEQRVLALIFAGVSLGLYFDFGVLLNGGPLENDPSTRVEAAVFLVGASVLWFLPDRK